MSTAGNEGRAVLISYKELSSLNERMTRIDTKLDIALTLPAKVEGLEGRISKLETDKAVRDEKGRWSGKAGEVVLAVILAIIATGVWWPKHQDAPFSSTPRPPIQQESK